jgi:hypothetical protein
MTVKTFVFVVLAVLVIAAVLFHAVQIRQYIDGFAVQGKNDHNAIPPAIPVNAPKKPREHSEHHDEPFHPDAVAKSVGAVPERLSAPIHLAFKPYSTSTNCTLKMRCRTECTGQNERVRCGAPQRQFPTLRSTDVLY